jgi:predicted alpha/beta hydrolase
MPRKRSKKPGSETIEVRTSDGWSLRADVDEPEGTPVGVALLAHAMMARRSSFDRPADRGVRQMLRARGWRVVSFDFRGHGQSGPCAAEGGSWSYDDLVRGDMPAMHACARSRERKKRPVVLVGHSLGAHVGLAAQGTGLTAFDALVSVAGNVWLRQHEASVARWALKRATLGAVAATCRRLGRFPARRLRIGSDDEAGAYFEDLDRFARTGRWTSSDGSHDYLASLGRVSAPVLQVVSDGDRLACVVECGARYLDACSGPRELLRVEHGDDGGPAPGHMGLVTSGRIGSVWERVEGWMRQSVVARRAF